MNTVCFLFIFAFEQFISYQYFNNKFEKKSKYHTIIIAYTLSFAFQFTVNLLEIPYLNLVSFFISNLVIVIVCFDANLKQVILNTFLIEAIMLATEIVAMYTFTTLLGINLTECRNNDLILFLETATTKAFYFLVTFVISVFSKKESKKINDYSILLFILPAASIITIVSFTRLSFTLEITKTTNILFTSISIVLLISNIIVFIVHEKIINTLMKNAEFQLEKQKEKINEEYYKELEKQYNSSSILIHDIKRILSNVKELSLSENNESISQYVDSVYSGYEINSIRKYSENRLINIIINRYANLCKEENVDFRTDVRNIDFSFITDSDLTALLDNLLENAYEASKISSKKEIDLTIDFRNEKYVIIKINNYSDIPPKIKGNTISTNKTNKALHGIGTKSIARIVKRYNGNIEYEYSENEHIFTATVLLKIQ